MIKARHTTRGLLLLLLIIVYLAIPNDRPDFTRFNAHDSESYLALSYNLAHGNGYTRNIDGNYVTHTLWPPGMALLLMPSVILSGDNINWLLVKLTMIAIGVIGVVFSWLYIRRMSGSSRWADIGAALLALNPYYWHFSHVAMAEMPVYVWCVIALYAADLLLGKSLKKIGVFTLGFLIGMGVLIKGVVLGLVFIPLGYFTVFSKWRIHQSQLIKCAIFAIGFIIVFAAWGLRNSQYERHGLGLDGVNQVQMMVKEVVEDPNSPYKTPAAILSTIKENIFWYGIYHLPNQVIPGLWLLDISEQPMSAVIGLLLTLLLLYLLIPRDRRLVPLFLLIASMVFMLALIEIGGSERYWFAVSMLSLLLIFCQLNRILGRHNFDTTNKFIVFKLALLGVSASSLAVYVHDHESMPYKSGEHWQELAEIYEVNRGLCNSSNVASWKNVYTKNVHAFRLISGCPASMTVVGIGYEPEYSHAILNKTALTSSISMLHKVNQNESWVFVLLPEPLTERQIKQRYYASQ